MLKHFIEHIHIFLLLYFKVWYLIVSISDLCTLTYFVISANNYPLSDSYTMVCPPVRRYNPRALANQIFLKRLKMKEI